MSIVQECVVNSKNEVLLQKIFHEIPDKNLAMFALILLIIISFIILIITFVTKCWFMLLVPITGFLIAAGYAFRIATMSNPTMFNIGAMHMLLIVPPLLFAVANYECLGKVMKSKNSTSKIIYWIPILFIIIDVVCLLMQIYGVTFLTNPAKINTGLNYMLGGLVLAIIVNIIFIVMLISLTSNVQFGLKKEFWICLYVTMILLLIRNVYKCIEFIQSRFGNKYLASHEIYMYLFDFTMLFICLILFAVLHYGFYLK